MTTELLLPSRSKEERRREERERGERDSERDCEEESALGRMVNRRDECSVRGQFQESPSLQS